MVCCIRLSPVVLLLVLSSVQASARFTPAISIGLANRLTLIRGVGGTQYDASFELVVENLGTLSLSDVQVTDDLDVTFPNSVTYSIIAGPVASGSLVANGGYDGLTDTSLLNAGLSTLASGASATISFTVRFDSYSLAGPFFNSAVAVAPGTTDTSDDGIVPDPDGDKDPSEPGENDPTVIALPASVTGIAKRLTQLGPAGGFNQTASFELVVENLSVGTLTNVQVTDNLEATFPTPVAFSVTSLTTTGTLVENGGFNGSRDTNLLDAAASTFASGAAETITLTILFDPNGFEVLFSTPLRRSLTGPVAMRRMTAPSPIRMPTTIRPIPARTIRRRSPSRNPVRLRSG